jgi:hypothetical protein
MLPLCYADSLSAALFVKLRHLKAGGTQAGQVARSSKQLVLHHHSIENVACEKKGFPMPTKLVNK